MKTKNITQKILMGGVLAMALLMPISQGVNATSAKETLANYQAYPTPTSKPLICKNGLDGKNDMHVSKKQAAVAALGLYLGIKQATATVTAQGQQQNLCA